MRHEIIYNTIKYSWQLGICGLLNKPGCIAGVVQDQLTGNLGCGGVGHEGANRNIHIAELKVEHKLGRVHRSGLVLQAVDLECRQLEVSLLNWGATAKRPHWQRSKGRHCSVGQTAARKQKTVVRSIT